MKIEIQAFWNAAMGVPIKTDLNAQEQLDKKGRIILCAIIIDGELRGEVAWNGKELSISKELLKPRDDLNP